MEFSPGFSGDSDRIKTSMVSLKTLLLCASAAVLLLGQESRVFEVRHAPEDIAPETDPNSQFWRGAAAIIAERDPFGKIVPGHRTEVRSRWAKQNLYFLFICPYERLNLKSHPRFDVETNQLWNWDVAEVFIGSDFQNIRRYKEFEVSPQGEWVDLDIDLDSPHEEGGWLWNSGFKVSTRVDREKKIWYAATRIPFTAISPKAPAAGMEF